MPLPPRPWWDRIAFALLLLLLLWAPLPLGSNRPWALALLGIAVWCALALLLGAAAWTGQARVWARLTPGAAGAALLAAFALLLVGQLLGAQGAPWAAGWRTADVALTLPYLYTTLVYLGVYLLVLATCGRPQRVRWVLGTVAAAGVLQATLAVLLLASGARYQLFFTDFHQAGRASGTFPNPDHLAGHMQLGLSAAVGLILSQLRGGEGAGDWKRRVRVLMQFVLSPKMLLRLTMLLMVVALVMTHSRMGNAAFFASLMLVGALLAARSRTLRRPALWLVGSMALVDLVVIGQWVGLDRVAQRMAGTLEATQAQWAGPAGDAGDAAGAGGIGLPAPSHEQSLQERLQIPRAALPLVLSGPWLGHGGGTFVLAMPAVKPPGFAHYWDHAHNDFVEIAVDTGWVGLGLLLALAGVTLWRAVPTLADAEPPDDAHRLKRGVGVAATMALCCMALHGMVDFNLHIPANAMTLVVLMALVFSSATGPVQRRRAPEGTQPPEESELT